MRKRSRCRAFPAEASFLPPPALAIPTSEQELGQGQRLGLGQQKQQPQQRPQQSEQESWKGRGGASAPATGRPCPFPCPQAKEMEPAHVEGPPSQGACSPHCRQRARAQRFQPSTAFWALQCCPHLRERANGPHARREPCPRPRNTCSLALSVLCCRRRARLSRGSFGGFPLKWGRKKRWLGERLPPFPSAVAGPSRETSRCCRPRRLPRCHQLHRPLLGAP